MAIQAPQPQPEPTLPEIRDIAPPIDVFPWPWWMVALVVLGAVLVLGAAAFFIWKAVRSRSEPPPPTAREVAFRELERLRGVVIALDPYAFSVRVSDVLRTYICGQYGVRATEQTSPEFLAHISSATNFSEGDRSLLAQFLERCDLIKFARVDATEEDSQELLKRAVAFVQGARV
jgi:hypothetical protein